MLTSDNMNKKHIENRKCITIFATNELQKAVFFEQIISPELKETIFQTLDRD